MDSKKMLPPLKILYFDDELGGDRLFLNSMARTLAAVQRASSRFIIVHGGESVRQMRAFNKYFVAQLTDEVVSAVGVQGSDKGLLSIDAEGWIHVNGGWIDTLVKQGVIPVVSCMGVNEKGDVRELQSGAVCAAFAAALAELDPVVVAFMQTNQPGVKVDGAIVEEISASDLPKEQAPHADIFHTVPVLLTNLPALREGAIPKGTTVHPHQKP